MIDYQTYIVIRYLRQRTSMNASQIGRVIGLSRNTVARWQDRTEGLPKKSGDGTECENLRDVITERLRRLWAPADVHKQLVKQFGFKDSLENLKKYIKSTNSVPTPEKLASLWFFDVIQGKVSQAELARAVGDRLTTRQIDELMGITQQESLMYRNRALAVLGVTAGLSFRRIAICLGIDRQHVKQHYVKYLKKGAEVITCRRNETRIAKYRNPDYISKFFSVLHSPPSSHNINRTTWRIKDIARIMTEEGFPIGYANVGHIIKDSGCKFRKAKRVLTSNDPAYREKLDKIKDTLANLGPKERFFSIDEYGPFAVKAQGGRKLVGPGQALTVKQWQKSKGSLLLTGALELSTNQMTYFYSHNKNTAELIKLLHVLMEKYNTAETLYLSWDCASWHASKSLYRTVDEINTPEYRNTHGTPKVLLAPLPARAQFLNVIEAVFSGMARAVIHNSDYESVKECKVAINRYFEERNQHFKDNPKRAGGKLWGEERVSTHFNESHNCKWP